MLASLGRVNSTSESFLLPQTLPYRNIASLLYEGGYTLKESINSGCILYVDIL